MSGRRMCVGLCNVREWMWPLRSRSVSHSCVDVAAAALQSAVDEKRGERTGIDYKQTVDAIHKVGRINPHEVTDAALGGACPPGCLDLGTFFFLESEG